LVPGHAFGEGHADAFLMLINDYPAFGREYLYDASQSISLDARSDPTDVSINCQYPITSGSSAACWGGGDGHANGQLLSGIWWDLRKNLGSALGQDAGLATTQLLFIAWTLITAGGEDDHNAASPDTLIEVLTVDDNDATLANGTPHSDSICAAFGSH